MTEMYNVEYSEGRLLFRALIDDAGPNYSIMYTSAGWFTSVARVIDWLTNTERQDL